MIVENGPRANSNSFFFVGGTLRCDHPSYVERAADRELYEALHRSEFCYVLTSRQMGKSSLTIRTAARLREDGVHVAVLDLTALGENQTAEQWYEGLLGILGYRLDLEEELEEFWLAHQRLGPLRRWMQALREAVLPALQTPDCSKFKVQSSTSSTPATLNLEPSNLEPPGGRLVIFIDEIDCVRSLPFSTDELFAAIRECYNRRTEDPEFHRLTFCLLGVATPSDLIQDTRRTPFNIGRRIELTDFTAAEAAPLALGLAAAAGEKEGRGDGESRNLLKRILHWTGGHPYLTQRLCKAVAEANAATPHSALRTPHSVDRLCAELFLSRRARERDDNLLFVRQRILRSEAGPAALLDLYGQVRAGKRLPVDDTNPLVTSLNLSGITCAEEVRPLRATSLHHSPPAAILRVRNRIYEQVFDPEWVAQHMPDAELRRQRAAYRRGLLRAASVAVVIIALMTGLALTATGYAFEAKRTADRERDLRAKLQAANLSLAHSLKAVEAQRRRADRKSAEARRSAQKERDQRLKAVAAGEAEQRQRLRAQQQERIAWAQRGEAERQRRLAEQRREESRRRQVRLNVASGTRLLEEGDLLGSLPWFTEALRLEQGNAAREEPHRLRLAAVLQQCPRLFQVWFHGASVSDAQFSPDGRRVVTASDDRTARVWDVATGAPVGPPLRHRDRVARAAFSPDGRCVVTASEDDTARVWEVATGRPVTPPLQHSDNVPYAEFSADGRRVVTASTDATARVWDAATGAPVTPPLRHRQRVVQASFSPDGRRIVSAGWDAGRVWDAATGEPISQLVQGAISVFGASFSPDGRSVVTANYDNTARVWNAATGEPVTPRMRHRSVVRHAGFSPDGRQIVTASQDRTARIWDAATGEPLSTPLNHRGLVTYAAFSPDGRRVVTFSDDGKAQVWDAASGERVASPLLHDGPVLRGAFSPDGRLVVTAARDSAARIWDLASTAPPAVRMEHSQAYVAFSPDGRRVATVNLDGTGQVADAATGRVIVRLRTSGGLVEPARFSPDGGRVLMISRSTARVWNAATGTPVTPPLQHRDLVRRAVFSAAGRHIVTASNDDTARVWDATTGRPVTTPLTHRDDVLDAAFSPDGLRVVTASLDGTAQIWSVRTSRRAGRVLRHRGSVLRVAFSPDGRRVVTASRDRTAQLWDTATGGRSTPPLWHGSEARFATFSPDGRRVLTLSDSTAQVWNAATGERSTLPMKHTASVGHAAFSPDGRRIVTVAQSECHLWDATTGETLAPPLKHSGPWAPGAAFSPDGRRIATAAVPHGGWMRDLPCDPRPVPDLIRLAQVLSGHRIDADIGFIPLPSSALRRQWQWLRSRYPADRSASPGQLFMWHLRAADDAEAVRDWKTALSNLDPMIQAKPGQWNLHARRANVYSELGQWRRAAEEYARATELGADTAREWYRMALLRLVLGDVAGYRRTCEAMLDRFGRQDPAPQTYVEVGASALAPDAVSDLKGPITLAERAAAASTVHAEVHHTLGTLLYRAGRLDEAVRRLVAANNACPNPPRPFYSFFLAMAHHRLGHAEESLQWLDRAVAAIEQETHGQENRSIGRAPTWEERLEWQLLRREAETLIGAGRKQ